MEFCRATKRFLQHHITQNHLGTNHLRLGQRFINEYIKDWPEDQYGNLYNMSDPEVAIAIVDRWLKDNNYEEHLPVPLNKVHIGGPA